MVALAVAAAATQAGAQGAGTSLRELEREFWRCDHEAVRRLLDAGTAAQCSIAYEALKKHRFGGDFAAMLAWWRANKDAEHLALSAEAERTASLTP
ncbi:MAG: hypothetical protein JNL87_16065 [Burkholderiaceae bacterium]|nr:hypothetical protein [Burkholderiaceae bacterium]